MKVHGSFRVGKIPCYLNLTFDFDENDKIKIKQLKVTNPELYQLISDLVEDLTQIYSEWQEDRDKPISSFNMRAIRKYKENFEEIIE